MSSALEASSADMAVADKPPTPFQSESGVRSAAILEALIPLAGRDGIDPEMRRLFSQIVFRLAAGVKPKENMKQVAGPCGELPREQQGGNEAVAFGDFLKHVVSHLERVLDPDKPAYDMTVCDFNLLRTADNCRAAPAGEFVSEYDSSRIKDKTKSPLFGLLHGTQRHRKYVEKTDLVSEQVYLKLKGGLEVLNEVAQSSLEEQLRLLQLAAPLLRRSLVLAAIPTLFDGQRLRTALQIAHDKFSCCRHNCSSGHSHLCLFGTENGKADAIFQDVAPNGTTVKRVLISIGMFVGLCEAGLRTVAVSPEREAAQRALDKLKADVIAHASLKRTDQDRKQHMFNDLMTIFAEWFADAPCQNDKFMCVAVAVSFPAFIVRNCDAFTTSQFNAGLDQRVQRFAEPGESRERARSRLRAVSLLSAANMASQWGDEPLSFHVAVSIAWCGAVYGEQNADSHRSSAKVGGPFILQHLPRGAHAECPAPGGPFSLFPGAAAVFTNEFLKKMPKFCAEALRAPKNNLGRMCSSKCKVMDAVCTDHDERKKNDGFPRIKESRFCAALVHLSIKENFMHLLKPSHDMSSGSADGPTALPLLHITAMIGSAVQQLPNCRSALSGHGLVECCNNNRTKDRRLAEVCKTPWIGAAGCAVLNTVLYHLAQNAFQDSACILNEIDENYYTSTAMGIFCTELAKTAESTFNVENALGPETDTTLCTNVFYVTHSFVKAYIATVKDSWRVWDGVKRMYSPNSLIGDKRGRYDSKDVQEDSLADNEADGGDKKRVRHDGPSAPPEWHDSDGDIELEDASEGELEDASEGELEDDSEWEDAD